MKLYAGIDLHSNNNFIGIINEEDQRIFQKRLPNNIETVLQSLTPDSYIICLPFTIRFKGPVGGAINVTAEAFSLQLQDVVPTFLGYRILMGSSGQIKEIPCQQPLPS